MAQSRVFDQKVKILLLGDCSVGKSSLLSSLFHNYVSSSYNPTLGAYYESGLMNLPGGTTEAMGVLLVYDITQHSSFDHISSWIRDFRGHTDPDNVVNIVLVGNKVDVSEGVVDRVDASMGRELADECRIRFFDTSGKT
ncbi:hypothetical protein Droror1_Dr00024796 [Drosera rotundifolia]